MANPIDVSQEELRFLRRCFRRFALPYAIAGIAAAVLAVALLGRSAPVDDSDEPAVQGLIAEAAGLREAIAALRGELEATEARNAERAGRIEQLERRMGRLADQVAEAPSGGADPKLRARFDEATRRLNALEARVAAAERHRRNALTLDGESPDAPPAAVLGSGD